MEGREVGRGREGRKKKVYMNIKAPVYNVHVHVHCTVFLLLPGQGGGRDRVNCAGLC